MPVFAPGQASEAAAMETLHTSLRRESELVQVMESLHTALTTDAAVFVGAAGTG